jgi:SWI/SNF related-matrix-associated actin-dependent regulator of chromatin subfamily C
LTDDGKGATHIIHSPPPPIPEEDWLRPLLKQSNTVLVHWWYYPDSYDTWVPSNEVDEEPEPPPTQRKQWEVNARWLLDLDVFNEWMNEEDYEISDSELLGSTRSATHAQGRSKRKVLKGKASSPDEVPTPESGRRGNRTKRRRSPSPAATSTPQTPEVKKRRRGRPPKKRPKEDPDDLTKDMDDPPPNPAVTEVQTPDGINTHTKIKQNN